MSSAPANLKSRVLADLNGLRNVAQGWDGYGAAPIDRGIIMEAEHFIAQVPDDFVITTQVVPMSRGRLQFEWHRGGWSLELELETPQDVHYLKSDPDAGIEVEDIIPIDDRRSILGLLGWFSAK